MSVARLLGENALMFLVGLGLLPLLGVAPTVVRLKRLWGVAYLTGMAVVGVVAATLASFSVPFPPIALAVAAVVSLVLGGRRIDRGSHEPQSVAATLDRAVAFVLVPTLAVAVGGAGWAFVSKPLRDWDGWAIWGLKAHAIAALGSSSGDVIASSAYYFSHLEYPLLLPGLDALGIRSAGGYESRLVVMQGVLVGFAGLLAIWGLLRDRVRPAVLWPTIAALASAPAVLPQLASGYADMPMAFFVACGLLAGARWLLEPRASWLALTSLFFAGAALSKDEGDLFAAAAYAGLLLAARGRRLHVLLSACAVACALIPWRVFIAVHDLSTSDFKLSKSVDPGWVSGQIHRAPGALAGLARYAVDVHLYALLTPIGFAGILLAIAGRVRSLAVYGATFAFLSVAGLVWIYVVSWIPLDFYLVQTQDRVTASVVLGCAALTPLVIAELGQPARADAAASVS